MNINIDSLIKVLLFLLIVFLGVLLYYIINIGNKQLDEKRKIGFRKQRIVPIIILFLVIIVYAYFSKRYSIVSDTLGTVIVSIVLAYLFNPIVNFLENKGIDRRLGILIIYIGIVAVILILSFIVVPKSIKESKRLFNILPEYIEDAGKFFQRLYEKYFLTLENLPDIFQGIQDVVMDNINNLQKVAFSGITSFFNGIINMFSRFISLVLIPILTFYFINDKEYFISLGKSIIPTYMKDEVLGLLGEIDDSLNLFVRGRLMLAVYVGVATTILLLILKVEFAIVIGFITGIADIVPYIGPFLGFLPAVFFAFLTSPIKAIWVSIIFVLIQWVENNVLAPKIIGDSTGIHPMTILLGLILGGGMFGVIGMIFSVPFIAVAKILFKFTVNKIRESKILED